VVMESTQSIQSRLKKILLENSDLAREDQKETEHPLSGLCYIAAEALFHLDGGREKYLIEHVKMPSGITHWYLRKREGFTVVDITIEQFYDNPPDHSKGKGGNFLTKKPSKRAQVIIDAFINEYDVDVWIDLEKTFGAWE